MWFWQPWVGMLWMVWDDIMATILMPFIDVVLMIWPGRQAATPTLPGAQNETGEPEVWERLFVFFWVRIHYHTIQTWLEITGKLESEKPGLDMWKFTSQINHWGIRALCRIMGMRATFFFDNFLSCNTRWRFSDFSIKWRSSFLIGTCRHHPQPHFGDLFGSGGSHERVPVLVHCWGPFLKGGREVEVMTPSVSRSVTSFSKMSNKLHFPLKLTSRPWK